MKSSTYFHMKTKMLADFQISISLPLRETEKTFGLLVLCIKVKFIIPCSLISLISKCTTFLFWNIRMCLIHDNRSTPSLLILVTVETHDSTKYQLMLRFAWKCLVYYLLKNKFPNFHYSPCQNLKEEMKCYSIASIT